tara:strand:+ start:52 stop:630 length:579 start_codon:yes stop_codon:yes gene_type:complete
MKKAMLFFLIISWDCYSQTNTIDCNNVTYYEDTFYVSLNDNIITNTIFYNDSNTMIYPNHCLILDTSLISVSYVSGPINTNLDCHIFTFLAQNSSRDTLDFDFQVTFNSNNFANNTVVNGDLVLGDMNSTCSTSVSIVLQNSLTSVVTNVNSQSKDLIRIVNILGIESKEIKNQPLFYIYRDGTVEKRMIFE